MIIVIHSKIGDETLEKIGEDVPGYTKVVVDIKREILAAGGKVHTEVEKTMLRIGSKPADLWGGGIDLKTGKIDFDAPMNKKPQQVNDSREVLDPVVRQKMEKIIRNLIK